MMEQEYRDFQAQSALRYLQTALVIDDEAELMGEGQAAAQALVPTPPVSSIFGTPTVTNEDVVKAAQAKEQERDSVLDFKVLADEFLSNQIICTAYRPGADEQPVQMSAKAAVRADIVIVDWFLKGKSSERAKEIIKEILLHDLTAGGRLRLIAVYTSQVGLEQVRDELLKFIEEDPGLSGSFSVEGLLLYSRDTHVRFFNKAGGLRHAGKDVVGAKDLPARLIKEFAELSTGLLSTFALNSVAALRDAANHIVSLFRPQLDGAYVSHHCTQKHPADALTFAIDFMCNELRTVLSINEIAEMALGVDKLQGWASSLGKDHVFKNHLGKEVDAPSIDRSILQGIAKAKVKQSDSAPKVKNPVDVTSKNLINTFFASADDAAQSAEAFARLTSFKREAHGASSFPKAWRPMLTLGSVLQRVIKPKAVEDQPNDAAQANKDAPPAEFLVCVQPRCDSVRLDSVCAFPFQSAVSTASKFNLVIRTSAQKDLRVCVNLKPRDTLMYGFTPCAASQRVEASRTEDGRFIFKTVDDEEFEWLGDLTDMKAQNFASTIGARVHGVGFDEFEWLRMNSNG